MFGFNKRKTLNEPRLRTFTDAGWKGFKDGARLPRSGIEPFLAELNYSLKDYIMILVCNKDDGTGRTAVRVMSPNQRVERLFEDEDVALVYAKKLTKQLSFLENSKLSIEYCLKNEFEILVGEG